MPFLYQCEGASPSQLTCELLVLKFQVSDFHSVAHLQLLLVINCAHTDLLDWSHCTLPTVPSCSKTWEVWMFSERNLEKNILT